MLTAMTIVLNHRRNERNQRTQERPSQRCAFNQIPDKPKNDQAKYREHPIAAPFERPMRGGLRTIYQVSSHSREQQASERSPENVNSRAILVMMEVGHGAAA
jgi:hypothetical protein